MQEQVERGSERGEKVWHDEGKGKCSFSSALTVFVKQPLPLRWLALLLLLNWVQMFLPFFSVAERTQRTLRSGVIGILVLLHTGSVTLGSYSTFWSPTLLTCAMRTLIETLDEQTIAQGHVKGSAVCQVHNSCLINGNHIVVCWGVSWRVQGSLRQETDTSN